MVEEVFLKRLEDLRRQKEQAIATIHAIDGAIQETNFWIHETKKYREPQSAEIVDVKSAD